MNRWIKFDLNDKTTWPAEKQLILVATKDKKFYSVSLYNNNFGTMPPSYESGDIEKEDVTHWMIPELPEEN